MLQEFEGIVIKRLPYNDNLFIAYIYTLQHGLLPFTIKKSNLSKSNVSAYLIPLGLVNGSMHYKPTSSFHALRNISTEHYLFSIRENFDKRSIAQFFADFLYVIIKYPHPDKQLYEFVKEFIFLLETASPVQIANIHLFALVKLTTILGFEPDHNYSPQHIYFDSQQGRFVSLKQKPYQFDWEISQLWHFFLNSTLQNFHTLPVSRELKNQFIESILQFYSYHLGISIKLSSLDVLTAVYEQ